VACPQRLAVVSNAADFSCLSFYPCDTAGERDFPALAVECGLFRFARDPNVSATDAGWYGGGPRRRARRGGERQPGGFASEAVRHALLFGYSGY
jgi:hypothetical protein